MFGMTEEEYHQWELEQQEQEEQEQMLNDALYDEEKEAMEKILMAEKDLIQSNADVVDNNEEQYLMDHFEQQRLNEEIEEGAYDMSHMNEDYDDGDFYGDELEEQGIYD